MRQVSGRIESQIGRGLCFWTVSYTHLLLLIWQGVPETVQANFTVQTLEGKFQDIQTGPVAALELSLIHI